jgi:hypothetical protein
MLVSPAEFERAKREAAATFRANGDEEAALAFEAMNRKRCIVGMHGGLILLWERTATLDLALHFEIEEVRYVKAMVVRR